MSLKASVASALTLAGLVAGQCSTSGTTTLQNAGDASALSSCTTYTGSIAIATDTAVDIAIDGVSRIEGSLTADNAVMLPSLSGDSLQTIDDDFTLTNMTLLTTLSFPELASVDIIDWTTLPRLSSLSFTTGISKSSSVSITDTTLDSLDGISLTSVDEFVISNNGELTSINMPLTEVTSTFVIEYNGADTVVSLPDLTTALNMTFRSVSSVSFPALSTVNSSLGFFECTFTSVSAANLSSVGGDLTFDNNDSLTNVSMPSLTSITGAFNVENNTDYVTISFAALKDIGGAVDIYGDFTSVSLPDLADVAGAFTLESSKDISSTCSHFEAEHGRDSVIKGTFTCTGDDSSASTTGSTSTSSSSSTQTGGASSELYDRSHAVTGLLGLFAAVMGLL